MQIIFSLLVTLLMISAPAMGAPKSLWGPCRGEIHSFCSQIPKGQNDEMAACLSKNRRNLSNNCKEHLAVVKERQKEAKRRKQDHIPECRAEEKTYCRNVEPGNGRIPACLRLHKHKLSNQCREAVKKKSLFY